MASITDCVVDGLKYPFTDIKKLLTFGAFFAVIDLLSLAISNSFLNIFRALAKVNYNALPANFSNMPAGDIYLIIGLSIVSFIISLFAMGYMYRITGFAIDKKPDFPGFEDILNLFVSGIKYFIVTLAYNIIPIIILTIGIIAAADQSYGGIIILISAILFIALNFLLIMALNNMIAYDQLSKAFDLSEITANISSLGWGKYIGTVIFTLLVFMIVMVGVGFVLSMITAVFTAVSSQIIIVTAVIGIIESLLVTSYGSAFYSRVFGLIYREAVK